MGSFTRDEIEQAFGVYQDAAAESGRTGDWRPWADLFTEDATYIEHMFGEFEGREAIYEWIQGSMSQWPNSAFTSFPIEWYVIDEEKGWVICHVWNRLEDPGDGSIHQEYNLTVLHYAGDGKWSFEEDIYNPEKFAVVFGAWMDRRRELQGEKG
jgi:ketosteroid isomerase-like protein